MIGTVTKKDSIHTGQAESTTQAHKKPRYISAILYRIPLPVTKVLILLHGDSYPICPRCNCTVDREYVSYCDRCGQHLNWELFDRATVIQAPRSPK